MSQVKIAKLIKDMYPWRTHVFGIYMTIMNFSTMPRQILYQSAVATN